LCFREIGMFNTLAPQILFQEVPDEVSLGFTVMGCQLRCKGCHSTDTWSEYGGSPLTAETFRTYLKQYVDYISCVIFFGGEWQAEKLIEMLDISHDFKLKTCLYTGLNQVPEKIIKRLTFLKTGPWIRELGGLDQATTNQKFIEVSSNRILNHKFQETH